MFLSSRLSTAYSLGLTATYQAGLTGTSCANNGCTSTPTQTPSPTRTVTNTPTVTNTRTSTTAPQTTDAVWTFYYYAGSSRVAERVNTNGTTALYFLFTDHLGSTSVVVDSSGAEVNRQLYRAFGTPRYTSGSDLTDYGYTGQRADDSIGLMYYNARWYDPALGRFTQADTIIPGAGNPLAWDRYAYVGNNPVRFTDPSGNMICDMEGHCGGTGESTLEQAKNRIRWDTMHQTHILQDMVDSGEISDLDAAHRTVEFVANYYPDMSTELFMDITSSIFLGNYGNVPAYIEMLWIEIRENPNIYFSYSDRFGQSGYNEMYQDNPEATERGGGNQTYHFWFYVLVGYESGFTRALEVNALHETIIGNTVGKSWQDFALGVEGAALGTMLSNGRISPNCVGDYMLENLGENAPHEAYWRYYSANFWSHRLYNMN